MTASDPTLGYRRDAAAIGLGVGVFGVTFGVLAVGAGLTTAQACAMSLLVFTGASQFAAVGVLDAGGTPAAALGSALLLAARNGLYGIALHDTVRGSTARRLLGAQLVIDESTAMALAQDDQPDRQAAFWLTGLAVFGCWNTGTLFGALGGSALGDPGVIGLDAAFPAGFIALIAPQLRRRPGLTAALGGGLIALVTIPLLPPGAPILVAALAVIPAFFVQQRA